MLLGDPLWQALFTPEGKLLQAGDTIRRTNYAKTLAILAMLGPDAFYEVPFPSPQQDWLVTLF